MTRFCHCHLWKELREKQLSYIGPKYPQRTASVELPEFLFCPWCGSRLTAPCVQCDTPSDEHTGKTIYWQEEKNFCSPACVMKFEKEEIRK